MDNWLAEMENGCFSMGMKLTTTEGAEYLTMEFLQKKDLLRADIESSFENSTGLSELTPTCLYFYHFNSSGFIDYIFLSLTFYFYYYRDKFFATQLLKQLKYFEFMHESNASIFFKIEPVLYNVTFSTLSQSQIKVVVYVHLALGVCMDTLSGSFQTPALFSEHCPKTKTRPLTKLHHCPHIVLSKNILPMSIENEFLFFYEDGTRTKLLKALSNWEYDSHNDTVSICLEDYLSFYHSLPERILNSVLPTYSVAVQAGLDAIDFLVFGLMHTFLS